MRPKVGSLFAGVEGFGQGLEEAGFEVAWQVEIDKDAVSVLERHYPTVRRYRDVREVKGSELAAVDVLVGGFPCQDLSVAGTRKGLAGQRSGLFFQVARIAAETATPWLLLENVDGLLSQWTPDEAPPSGVAVGTEWEVEESPDLGLVLSTLQEHGYLGCLRVLDARYFGVPQRRERVFIVGHLGATGARALDVLLEPDSVLRDLASCLEARQGAPGLPENGAGGRGIPPVAHTLRSNDNGTGASDNAWNTTYLANTLNTQQRGVGEPGDPSYAVSTTSAPAVAFTNRGETVEGAHETLRAASHGALPMVQDAWSVRRLMPIECERLQGWPDGWTALRANGKPIKDDPRYRMIGNGVVKNVARWIGRRLLAAISEPAS